MPKTRVKFTAEFTTKIGKTPVEIKVPINFTEQKNPGQSFPEYVQALHDAAAAQLSSKVDGAAIKFLNKGALKAARKAYDKSVAK